MLDIGLVCRIDRSCIGLICVFCDIEIDIVCVNFFILILVILVCMDEEFFVFVLID